ncbi:MAG: Rne/Rng family ribonuclease [Armatimonadetes bacterium]|nr:Rne/Rng family ribonuclease [Armatimonadota bacterium]
MAIVENGHLVELLCERGQAVVGNIYKGRVENVVPALDAAFVDCGIERNVFLHVSDAVPYDPIKNGSPKLPRIKDLLHEGDEVLVQVTKGPVESKGARATVRLTLPGRYCVLVRDGQAGIGVSKKIEDPEERRRLRDLAAELRPEGWGIIVRTRAQGVQRQELQSDLKFLLRTWRAIETRARAARAPAVVYEDLSLVFEILRDVVDQRVRQMLIDDRETFEKVRRFLSSMAPGLRDLVKLYEGKRPIFTELGIERELDKALKPRVWLPHGGHINIEETEALTVVDVNSGRFTATGSLADTVLRTNLEAAEEIGRQLRLRDIGGIVVIDFIDMDRPEHRERVAEAMRRVLAADRMRTRIMHITRLGLLEMTRKRTDLSLSQRLQEPCPWCDGTGRVLHPTTIATRIVSDLRTLAADSKAEAFAVVTAPAVALALVGEHGELAEGLEREEVGRPVLVRVEQGRHPEKYEITPGTVRTLEKRFGRLVVGDVIEIGPEHVLHIEHPCLLTAVKGVLLEVTDHAPALSGKLRVRLVKTGHSYARGVVAK